MLVSGRVTPIIARSRRFITSVLNLSRLVDGLLVEKGGGIYEELVMMVEES